MPAFWPRTLAAPSVALMTPSRILISVVLPAPFWPKRPKISPRSTVSETPLRARIRPYCLVRLLVWMTDTDTPLRFAPRCLFAPAQRVLRRPDAGIDRYAEEYSVWTGRQHPTGPIE